MMAGSHTGTSKAAVGIALPKIKTMRITDKLRTSDPFVSFEFFPPSSDEGMTRLFARVDAMAPHEPLFVDVTWNGDVGSLSSSLAVAAHAQKVPPETRALCLARCMPTG